MRIILSLVLFISACSAGYAHHSPAPDIIKNVGTMSGDPFGPTLESNRAALVWIGYSFLDMSSGKYYTVSSVGWIVGPHAIINMAPANLNYETPQSIMVQSVLGRWSGVYASITARLGYHYTDIMLLTTIETLPQRPIIFGESSPGMTTEGYSLVVSQHLRSIREVMMAVEVDESNRACSVSDPLSPHRASDWDMPAFNTEHRLVCFGALTSRELAGFLRDNGVRIRGK